MMSASVHGDAGTSSAGLKTTQLPQASAGAIFQAGIASGKFHGVIAATTPIGSRVISTSMPGRVESIFSPPGRSASPAKNLKMYPARAASPIPSASGFPCSRESSRPSSSLRARISVPARSRMSNRSCGVVRDHFLNAVRADAMAWSTSDGRRAGEFADDVGEVRRVDVGACDRSSRWSGRRSDWEMSLSSRPHGKPRSGDVGEVAQDVDHRGEVLRAVSLRRAPR